MSPSHFRFRMSLCYALLLLGAGVQMPFFPLWLKFKGLPVEHIGLVLAAMTAVRVITVPLVARRADARGNRLSLIKFSAFVSVLAYGALALVSGFWPILLVSLVAAALSAPVFPLIESFAVDGAAAHGLDYGQIRLWASLSFLAGNLGAGGLLTVLPMAATIHIIIAALVVAALATLLLPEEAEAHRAAVAASPPGNLAALLAFGLFPLFLIVTAVAQTSHAVLYCFASVQWQNQGFPGLAVGTLWAIGVLAEVTMFAVAGRVIARFGVIPVLLAGIAGGAFRWTMMALAPPLLWAAPLQVLHAASFATVHIATMHYMSSKVPAALRNTAQGLNASVNGAFMTAMTWIAGSLFGTLGAQSYLAMASLSLVALALGLRLARFSPRAAAAADT